MRESFKFPVDPVTDRNPPRQILQVQTLRTLMFFQNALSEIQDRIEEIEKAIVFIPDEVAEEPSKEE